MAAGNECFLSRWSRLKGADASERAEGHGAAMPQSTPPPAASRPAVAEPAAGATSAPRNDDLPLDLPDITTLTKDSDFTVFMRPDVPLDLQRDALRALWKSDPIFSYQDGLTDYAEDFTKPVAVGDAVKTAWKIGKGFLDDVDEPPKPEKTAMPPSPPEDPSADEPA